MHSRHRRIYAIYPSLNRGNTYSHNSNLSPHFQRFSHMQLPRRSINKLPMEVQKTISYIIKDKYYSANPAYESSNNLNMLTLEKSKQQSLQQQQHNQQPNELRKIKIVYIPQYQYTYASSTPANTYQQKQQPHVVSTTLTPLTPPVKLSPLVQKTSTVLSTAAPSIVSHETTSTQIKLVPDINYNVIHEVAAPILSTPDLINNNKYVSADDSNDLDDSNNSIIYTPNNQFIKYVYKNPEKYELLRGEQHVGNFLESSYSYPSTDLKQQRPQDNTAPILFHPNTTQAPDINYSTAATATVSTTKDYSYNSHSYPHKDFIPITENEETSYSSTPSSSSLLISPPSTSDTETLSHKENEFYSFEENNSNVIHITPSPHLSEASSQEHSSSPPAPLSLSPYIVDNSAEKAVDTPMEPLKTIDAFSPSHDIFTPSIDTLVSKSLIKYSKFKKI